LGEGSKGRGEQGRSEQGRGKPCPYILILPGEDVDKELLGGAAVDADA
jgi:hypothetical protein